MIGIGNKVLAVVVSRRAWQASPRSAELCALMLEVETLRQQLNGASSKCTLWQAPTPPSSARSRVPCPSLHDWELNLTIGLLAGSSPLSLSVLAMASGSPTE